MATNDRSMKIQSLALPAIGCGQWGCHPYFVAKTLITAVAYELERQSELQLSIYFVIEQRQQNILDIFCKQLVALDNNRSDHSTVPSLPVPPSTPMRGPASAGFVPEKYLLNNSDNHYVMAAREFTSTMTSSLYSKILRIELVWNARWYKQYMIHKEHFFQRLQSDTEKHLFHGCPASAANNIIDGCFNRSCAGVNGTVYGHGTYFSSNASYSHSYAIPNSKGERCMFLAKVLIGKTTVGDSSMKLCPPGFDSTTDESHIYVIYHDAQAFGHYLITYK